MSQLDTLPGNSRVKFFLKKLLKQTPHALLFEGPKGVGKGRFAKAFAQDLLQSLKKEHPDFFELFPEGKALLHPMHAIRSFIKATQMPPFEADRKIFLIHDADRMLPSSANALLKTLEEPVSNVTIILISSHPQSLLPTVISRCFRVPFVFLTEEELINHLHPQKSEQEARAIALLSHGSLEKAETLAEQETDPLLNKMFDLGICLLNREFPSLKQFGDIKGSEEAFSYLFYFFRDLHLLKIDADSSLLFFRDKEQALKECLKCSLPPLDVIQEKMERIYRALELHIPFSHSLCEFYQ